jgi:hypothetical protein
MKIIIFFAEKYIMTEQSGKTKTPRKGRKILKRQHKLYRVCNYSLRFVTDICFIFEFRATQDSSKE